MEASPVKMQYLYNDEENIKGILQEEMRDINQLLPPLVFPVWTDKEKDLIAKLREVVKDHIVEIEGHYLHTDFYLSRFLLSREWDITLTAELFISCMKWRKENNVNTITEDYVKTDQYKILSKYWPATACVPENNFWTYDNTPVAYDRVGLIDTNILNVVSQKDITQFHVFCIESIERKFAAQYYKTGTITGALMIMDLEGFSMDFLGLMDLLKALAFIDENYFPACLRGAILINTPSFFSFFWTIIKTFLHPEVQKKITVLGSDKKSNETYLKKIIPSRFLLKSMGGDCKYELPIGGSCKDLGKNFPMYLGQTRKVILARNSYYEHKIEHLPENEKGLTLKWEFSSDDHVKFGIFYRKNHDEKEKSEIVKFEKKKSKNTKITGTHEIKSVGCYYLTFHNDTYLYETSVTYFLTWD